MSDRFVIEDNLVRHERVSILGVTTLEQLAPHLVTHIRADFGLLPRGAIWHSIDKENRRALFLIERPPQITHMRIGARTYRVQIPWNYFLFYVTFNVEAADRLVNFAVGSGYQFWRPIAMTEADMRLWWARTPNISQGGSICWGGTLDNATNDSLAGRINHMVNSFYVTTFNSDLGLSTPFGGSAFNEWVRNSEDGMAYLEWELWNESPTITDLASIPETYGSRLNYTDTLDTSDAIITLPEMPASFTVGRARETLAAMTEGQRRRWVAAVRELTDEPLPDIVLPDDAAVPA